MHAHWARHVLKDSCELAFQSLFQISGRNYDRGEKTTRHLQAPTPQKLPVLADRKRCTGLLGAVLLVLEFMYGDRGSVQTGLLWGSRCSRYKCQVLQPYA